MPYQVRTEERPNTSGLDPTVVILANSEAGAWAEVWPALGFNCFRWQTRAKEQLLDLLYADPDLFAGGKPTRTGIPILFPFPNRLRGGRFRWEGKEYQLPITDSSGPNAIHGFACRKPWRVVDQGANHESAWVTGEFHGAVDAPESRPRWPADHVLRITCRLQERSLRIESQVSNPDRAALPFGLGFHPYFRVPFVPGSSEQDYMVQCAARSYWELEKNLPTGKRLAAAGPRDLTVEKRLADLKLDDVLADLQPGVPHGGLQRRGQVRDLTAGLSLELWTSPAFGELVVFTPPHRQAVCLEPYTCTTDALNLQSKGIEAGLLVLQPGAQWQGVVEVKITG